MAIAESTVGELVKAVRQDLGDRKDWEDRQAKNVGIRYGDRKPRSLPYPNAPRLSEPLADDLIEKITSTEVGMLWASRVLAVFTPLSMPAMLAKRDVEDAFDTLLRDTLNIRAKLEELFDLKNERGMAVAKLTEPLRQFGVDRVRLPDFEALDPLEVVVPTGTKRMRDADRVCHIVRYSARQFLAEAQVRGWANAQAVLDRITEATGDPSGTTNNSSSMNQSDRGTNPRMGSRELANSTQEVVVWEVYHWRVFDRPVGTDVETSETAAPAALTEQRRWVTILCPDAVTEDADPDDIGVMATFPWKWPDVQTMEQTVDPMTGAAVAVAKSLPAPDRPWPFVQFRRECRRSWYYDTRGIPERVEDDQKEATTYRNSKAVLVDYFCKPFLKGGQAMAATFKFRPGETLPDGVDMVWPDHAVNPVFDYSCDMARAIAARRVGSPEGGLSSADKKREVKTATEVSSQLATFNQFSQASVERFAEPLAELFTLMWEYLAHNPVPIPIPSNPATMIPPEVFTLGWVIGTGVNGKLSNPDMMLRYMESASPLLRALPQIGQFIRGDQMASMIFELIDPKLARRLVVDPTQIGPNGTAPIEQQVAMLTQAVQSQQQYLGQMAQQELGMVQEEGEEGDEGGEGNPPAAGAPKAPVAGPGPGQPGSGPPR